MSDFQRILVLLSPDQDNTELLAKVARLSLVCDASIELFCVAYCSSLRHQYLFDADGGKHAEQGYVKGVERSMEKYQHWLEGQGVRCGVDVYWAASCSDAVLRKIGRDEPDLVMLAPPQEHSLRALFREDHVRRLMRECPVPLMLIAGGMWGETPVFAATVDPLHACEKPLQMDKAVMDMTVALQTRMNGDLRVIHAYHTLPQAALFDEYRLADYEGMQSRVKKDHKHQVDELLRPYEMSIADTRVAMLDGELHRLLPDYVTDHQVSMVVTGHVVKSAMERLLSGSTVERLLEHLGADLMILKPPGFKVPAAGWFARSA